MNHCPTCPPHYDGDDLKTRTDPPLAKDPSLSEQHKTAIARCPRCKRLFAVLGDLTAQVV